MTLFIFVSLDAIVQQTSSHTWTMEVLLPSSPPAPCPSQDLCQQSLANDGGQAIHLLHLHRPARFCSSFLVTMLAVIAPSHARTMAPPAPPNTSSENGFAPLLCHNTTVMLV